MTFVLKGLAWIVVLLENIEIPKKTINTEFMFIFLICELMTIIKI